MTLCFCSILGSESQTGTRAELAWPRGLFNAVWLKLLLMAKKGTGPLGLGGPVWLSVARKLLIAVVVHNVAQHPAHANPRAHHPPLCNNHSSPRLLSSACLWAAARCGKTAQKPCGNPGYASRRTDTPASCRARARTSPASRVGSSPHTWTYVGGREAAARSVARGHARGLSGSGL